MNVYDLKGQTAIVTGGAQGIGLAVANRILELGRTCRHLGPRSNAAGKDCRHIGRT